MSIKFPNHKIARTLPADTGAKKEISIWQKWKKPVLFAFLALATVSTVGALLSSYGTPSSNPPPSKGKIDRFLQNEKALVNGLVSNEGWKVEWHGAQSPGCPSCYRVCHRLRDTFAMGCSTIDEPNLTDFLCAAGNLDLNECGRLKSIQLA